MIYIDGQNFHKRLRESCINKKLNSLKNELRVTHKGKGYSDEKFHQLAWDALKLINESEYILNSRNVNLLKLIKDHTIKDRVIQSIKYYGAKFPLKLSTEKHNADDKYFTFLKSTWGVQVNEGRFVIDKDNRPKEKGVDVKLAIDIVSDAFHGLYDTAFVFSQDTDLLPAIELVRNNVSMKGLRFICVTFDPLSEHRKHYHHVLELNLKTIRENCYEPELHKPEEDSLKKLAEKFNKK